MTERMGKCWELGQYGKIWETQILQNIEQMLETGNIWKHVGKYGKLGKDGKHEELGPYRKIWETGNMWEHFGK